MSAVMRSCLERRSGEDRRRVHDLEYLANGGIERRIWKGQRSHVERRVSWARLSEWCNVSLKAPKGLKLTVIPSLIGL